MARALRAALDPGRLTVIVNVGDDTERYGVHVSADPDTVLYTLAGVVGPHGWGRAGDTTVLMDELGRQGFDTSFTLGDRDYALCLARSLMMESGSSLSAVTRHLARSLGVDDVAILPATDDPVSTWVQTSDRSWLEFQEYFVDRRHEDEVAALAYHGAAEAEPAGGVVEAIETSDLLVIAPSNPPLSIWPILAVDAIDEAVRSHRRRIAVSPLFGGRPLKGPADRVMAGVGLPIGTAGILEAYAGRIDALVVDTTDADDVRLGDEYGTEILVADTHLTGGDRGAALVECVLGWVP